MIITILNLTATAITAHTYPTPSKFTATSFRYKDVENPASDNSTSAEFILLPSQNFTTVLPKGFTRELILRQDDKHDQSRSTKDISGLSALEIENKALLDNKEWHIHPEGFQIRFSMSLGASWQVVPVPDHCPWRIYTRRVRGIRAPISNTLILIFLDRARPP